MNPVDATSADLGLSRDDFLKNLAASRLMSDADFERFLANHPGADVLAMAHALLTAGTLTDYQLDAISQGRPGDVRIGNYDILSRLGAGGMGTVFKARHRRMKRIVALKVLSAALCKDTSFVQRFQQEVETIARLGHPNIVMAYDADEAGVGHFLVMEFVDGRDLTSFTEQNHPLDVPRAIDCILQSSRGLAYAHAQGVIHRDIKPANLLRDANGAVKVTDLGLARLNSGGADSSAAHGLTQAGGVLGTVDYMAPEQAVDSTTIDARADIYSLGATLYFLLTGRAPYSGKSVMSVLLKHRESPVPSLRELRPDVPAELDAIFQRMMAKSPADRFADMTAVATALEGITSKAGSSASLPRVTPLLPSAAKPGSSVSLARPDANTLVTAPHALVTVMIVEPSRAQAGIIRRYLEANDIAVSHVFTTGEPAVGAARENRPDAVLSALHLPDMTGVELAKQIQAEFRERPPGFVLISSESDDNDSGAISRLSRVALLPKPFTPEQLIQSLNAVTGKSIAVKSTGVSMTGISIVRPGSGTVPPAKPKADRSALHVLIVDDSAAARVHERGILQGLGYARFNEAEDGAQAIAAATREPFDLIVTDYNMPLMDGHALVSYLRQTPATAAIPIIMVTTETAPEILDPVRKLGVTAVFDKMFPVEAVRAALDKLFG